MGNLLFLFFLGTLIQTAHPFYLGLMEVHYKKEQNKLEITHKAFFDDLEVALTAKNGAGLSFAKHANDKNFKLILESYLDENIEIQINGKALKAHQLGFELEDDVVWLYMECDVPGRIKTLTIKNSLLCDFFKDQQNVINFYANSKRPKSGITRKNNTSITFDMN